MDTFLRDGFERSFLEWEASGFDLRHRPTIDRIDPNCGYERHNVQIASYAENARRAILQRSYGKQAA